MLIFGYDEFIDGHPTTNGFRFKDNTSPINLGFAGYKTDENIKDSELCSAKSKFSCHHRHHYSELIQHFDISIEKVSEIKDKYYYIIDVFPYDFWMDEDAKNVSISEQAVNDIRSKKAKILVLFPNEGLYAHNDASSVLNSWILKYKLPHGSIVLVSGNYIYGENIRDSYIKYIPFSVWEHSIKEFCTKELEYECTKTIEEKRNREKVFLNYNRRARYPRCKLVYELGEHGVIDDGYVSLGSNFDYSSKASLPIEFLNSLPLKFDDTDLEINHAHELIAKDFLNSYVSLVSETVVNNGNVFPSEKIFKPIIALHPFIVYSSPGFLIQMKEFGYKTFSMWFDESYDNEQDLHTRIEMIIAEIKKLTMKSSDELNNMLVDMLPTLKHNLNTYIKRTSSKEFQEQLEVELWK